MGFFAKLFGSSNKKAEVEADEQVPMAEMGEPESPVMDAPEEGPATTPAPEPSGMDTDVDVDLD